MIPYQSAWAGAIPPDGPASGFTISVGFWFEVDTPGVLRGFRHYLTSGERGIMVAELWASDGTTLLGSAITKAAMAMRTEGTNKWRSVWCHPRVPLVASTRYLVQMQYSGQGIYRDDSLLNEFDYTNGHFLVPALTETANSGGRYHEGFDLNSPADNPTSNMYGIDVLVEFPPEE